MYFLFYFFYQLRNIKTTKTIENLFCLFFISVTFKFNKTDKHILNEDNDNYFFLFNPDGPDINSSGIVKKQYLIVDRSDFEYSKNKL